MSRAEPTLPDSFTEFFVVFGISSILKYSPSISLHFSNCRWRYWKTKEDDDHYCERNSMSVTFVSTSFWSFQALNLAFKTSSIYKRETFVLAAPSIRSDWLVFVLSIVSQRDSSSARRSCPVVYRPSVDGHYFLHWFARQWYRMRWPMIFKTRHVNNNGDQSTGNYPFDRPAIFLRVSLFLRRPLV